MLGVFFGTSHQDRQYQRCIATTTATAAASVLAYKVATGPGLVSKFGVHVLCMSGAAVAHTYSVTSKRVGGRENVIKHMWAVVASSGLLLAGFAAIFLNKEANAKKHITTLHGQAGILFILQNLCMGCAGYYFLHPENQKGRATKTIRTAHRYGGRALNCVLAYAVFSGSRSFLATKHHSAFVGVSAAAGLLALQSLI